MWQTQPITPENMTLSLPFVIPHLILLRVCFAHRNWLGRQHTLTFCSQAMDGQADDKEKSPLEHILQCAHLNPIAALRAICCRKILIARTKTMTQVSARQRTAKAERSSRSGDTRRPQPHRIIRGSTIHPSSQPPGIASEMNFLGCDSFTPRGVSLSENGRNPLRASESELVAWFIDGLNPYFLTTPKLKKSFQFLSVVITQF
jgi:hypothetical protein